MRQKPALILAAGLIASAISAPSPSIAQERAPARWQLEFPKADFSKSSVDFSEILSGGPGRDGIPAIDKPRFARVFEEKTLTNREPVITVDIGGDARAYPIRYLMWHEIVNDKFGNRKVTVTFCPLCNSALVFDGKVGGRTLTFGVSGRLRKSDMIMYDRQTESWWQQFTGEAIVGKLTGRKLTVIPSVLESWGSFKAAYPNGKVMRQPTNFRRAYGSNPYVGYDGRPRPYPFFTGEKPPHGVPALARVVRVGSRAWPLSRLSKSGEITEAGVRLTWKKGQASALDTRQISRGRDVGTVRAFSARTGKPIAYEVVFAFVFHAFEPNGSWMLGR